MINTTEKGVWDSIFHARKEFVINVKHSDTATHLHIVNQRYITNNLVSTFNQKLNRRKTINRTTIYRETDRMNLIYELDLCDDGKKLSNKDK